MDCAEIPEVAGNEWVHGDLCRQICPMGISVASFSSHLLVTKGIIHPEPLPVTATAGVADRLMRYQVWCLWV